MSNKMKIIMALIALGTAVNTTFQIYLKNHADDIQEKQERKARWETIRHQRDSIAHQREAINDANFQAFMNNKIDSIECANKNNSIIKNKCKP